MADTSKFGGGRGAQFGDRISPNPDAGHCAQCETMLADALDGTLGPEDQALFDAHMALCGLCADMLADARRGVAWLEMLRDPRPEPPAELLERILAQTSGLAAATTAAPASTPEAVFTPALRPTHLPLPVLPFRQRFALALRRTFSGHVILQPRFAMTAAMAFFSIALTMNLTGVRLSDLRPGDLRPSSIKRSFYSANARFVQYYEGLRVVYELESRVHDLESSSDSGTQAPSPQNNSDQPSPPSSQGSPQVQPQPKPAPKTPGPGSSRRESLLPSARLVATSEQLNPETRRPATSAGNEWIHVLKVRALA